jgi:sugar phosphate isomerase/epimerase
MKLAGSAPAFLAAATPPQAMAQQGASRMGIAVTAVAQRMRQQRGAGGPGTGSNPLELLEYCRSIGAGGMQAGLSSLDGNGARQLRRKAEEYGMYVEGTLGLPRGDSDLPRFQDGVRTAKNAGATVIRSVMLSGRRYETFQSAEAFQTFSTQSWNSLTLAEPIIRKNRMKLAIENHKDWRIDEMLSLMKRISSEFVGVTVDTGNNIALLEDPIKTVEALAPHAYSVHLKDMGVKAYEDGFLLSEIVFGEGYLDLGRVVNILRQAQPSVRFNLEMITRDPIQVPCLSEGYWPTFANLPGRDLASMIRTVRAEQKPDPLPMVGHLSTEERVQVEEDNNRKCLAFARDRLNL